MKKVIIIGSPGAGKSYLANQLAVLLGLPLYHIDQIYWHEDKTHISHEELVQELMKIMKDEVWIIDGNYQSTMEIRMKEADTIIFLDYSVEQCMEGIYTRVGTKRSDLPWKEGGVDDDFHQFVKGFQERPRIRILELLNRQEGKQILTFQNRRDAELFVRGLLPESITKYIEEKECRLITENHRSGDLVYQVGEEYILKISLNKSRLKREHRANEFMKGKLPVSESIVYEEQENIAYYLKTCVKGTPLTEGYIKDPVLLAKLLADAMKMVHGVDVSACSILCPDSTDGDCFVHGDFCLPNILAIGDQVSGLIDTEAAGVGDPWMDYAWCIWSYEYNLGTKEYTPILLEKLGIEFDPVKFAFYTER